MTTLRKRYKMLYVLGRANTNFTLSTINKPTIGQFQFKSLNCWFKDYENSFRDVTVQLNGNVQTYLTFAWLKAYRIKLSNLFGDGTVDNFSANPISSKQSILIMIVSLTMRGRIGNV
jgi:hypothetical protein